MPDKFRTRICIDIDRIQYLYDQITTEEDPPFYGLSGYIWFDVVNMSGKHYVVEHKGKPVVVSELFVTEYQMELIDD